MNEWKDTDPGACQVFPESLQVSWIQLKNNWSPKDGTYLFLPKNRQNGSLLKATPNFKVCISSSPSKEMVQLGSDQNSQHDKASHG